jgi:hypothetical protein
LKAVTWFGTLKLSDNGEIEECSLLEKDPEQLAENMLLAVEKKSCLHIAWI